MDGFWPLHLAIRLPLAATWLAALVLALLCGAAFNTLRPELFVVGAPIVLQWLLVQMPLWLVVGIYGLHIAHERDLTAPGGGAQQFGIRQLMMLAAIVAVVLGASRLLVGGIEWNENRRDWTEGARFFGPMILANTLVALSMLAAVRLLSRILSPASAIVVAAALGLTFFEHSCLRLVAAVHPMRADAVVILLLKNLIQCAWVLAFGATR